MKLSFPLIGKAQNVDRYFHFFYVDSGPFQGGRHWRGRDSA